MLEQLNCLREKLSTEKNLSTNKVIKIAHISYSREPLFSEIDAVKKRENYHKVGQILNLLP